MNTSHSDYPFDLGTHCPAFVVTNDEAAAWFATGLSWLYGFNHEEAIGCFRHAARADDGVRLLRRQTKRQLTDVKRLLQHHRARKEQARAVELASC